VETTTTKLTTAVEVMAAFNAVANDAELNKNPESAELLKNLAQIFIHRPIGEIDGSIENITDAYQTAIGKMFTVYIQTVRKSWWQRMSRWRMNL